MPKVDHIQTSFAGGVFGSSLFGRTDLAQYETACEIVENMLIRPYGSAISTPGTRYIATVSDSTLKTRLLRFVFSRADAYVIEFGPAYFRFYTSKAVVITTGTTPYQLAHTYTESELKDVRFTQRNDVIWLTHPNHKQAQLTRLSSNNWTLADFDVLGGPYLDDNTVTTSTISFAATAGVTTITSSTSIFSASHTGAYFKVGGTSVTSAATGLGVQGYFKVTAYTSGTSVTGEFVKIPDIAANVATDEWAEGAWSQTRGYPAFTVFQESRLFFARTDFQPQNVWGSKTFRYDDFAVDTGQDDDALNLQCVSNEANEIKWLISGEDLYAGTFGGDFVISSGNIGDPLTPGNAFAKSHTSWGSESIAPAKIGNFIYYIQRFGQKLREFFYFEELAIYKSVDKTILSPDSLGKGIVDMAYQQNPDTVLWCVRTDGTIATLTREIDQKMTAWSKQTTAGTYSAITAIPSQTELYDEVWVIVERWIEGVQKKYVEVFENTIVPDRQDKCWYLHSALSWDSYDATSASNSNATISFSATSGTGVNVTSSTAYFASNDVGQRIRTIDENGVTTGEMEITSFTSSTSVNGTIKTDFASLTTSTGKWGLSVSSLAGLDHLEGEEARVLADGGVDLPVTTVATGAITLAYDYFVVLAGLSYDQKLQTLPVEAGSARGTSQAKIQRIYQTGFKVNRSHKGFFVGGTETLAEQFIFRDPTTEMGTPELLFSGTIPNVNFRDDYRYGSQVFIKNSDPLPIEMLSIVSLMTTADK